MSVSAGDRKLLALSALVTAIVGTYAMRQANPDLWGHLSSGRLFVSQGTPVVRDPFAYTSTGHQWIAFEYLGQVLLWNAYRAFGPSGLIALKCLAGGVTLYFLHAAVRASGAAIVPATWLFVLCASTVSRFFSFHPQLFTFLFFALFVSVVFKFLNRRRTPVWILPVAMLVWVNTHGGFPMGLLVVGMAILIRASENIGAGSGAARLLAGTGSLWTILAVCVAATFVNPWGWRLWAYVLTEVWHDTNRRVIAEWRPPSLQGDTWSMLALMLTTAILVVVGSVAVWRTNRQQRWTILLWIASCVPFVVMAYAAVRHIPIALLWFGPVLAQLGTSVSGDVEALRILKPVWRVTAGAGLMSAFLTLTYVCLRPTPVISTDGALGSRDPCRAMAFVRGNHLAGNLYAPLWWGSYLTWELYPAIRVSIDGRNISLYPDEMVEENLNFYTAADVDLAAPMRYDTDFVLAPSDAPVVSRLNRDPRWLQIYSDMDAILLVRADSPRQPSASRLTQGSAQASGAEICSNRLR